MITIRRFNTIINKLRLPVILWSTASTCTLIPELCSQNTSDEVNLTVFRLSLS